MHMTERPQWHWNCSTGRGPVKCACLHRVFRDMQCCRHYRSPCNLRWLGVEQTHMVADGSSASCSGLTAVWCKGQAGDSGGMQ